MRSLKPHDPIFLRRNVKRAWRWAHRVLRACTRPGDQPVSARGEADGRTPVADWREIVARGDIIHETVVTWNCSACGDTGEVRCHGTPWNLPPVEHFCPEERRP